MFLNIFFLIFKMMNFLTSFFFLFMKHPLAMGLTLMFQTFIISLITGMSSQSFWFSYMLFLIFVGAMLILFIYIAALASNEMFNFFINFYLIMFIMILFLFIDKNFSLNYIFNYDNSSMEMEKNLNLENSYLLVKIYNYPINLISIILMIYLFLTLIATVKITNISFGPLRQLT